MPELRAKEDSLSASRAVDAEIDIPAPDGLSYLPFQKAGIAFGLKRDSVLIGDEMGLGKTIQAIGIINGDESIKKVLVICPATPKINWKREMTKWLVRDFDITVQMSKNQWDYLADINIINYDILKANHDQIHSTKWDMVIVDECHWLKSPDAQRTQEIVGKYYNWKKMTVDEIDDVLFKFRTEKLNDAIMDTDIKLTDHQAYGTFHGGCGMLLVIDEADTNLIIQEAQQDGIKAQIVGETTNSEDSELIIHSRFKEGKILSSKKH